jgi:hypothetical protein
MLRKTDAVLIMIGEGTSGQNQLVVSGGGTMTMGTETTNVAKVNLASVPGTWTFTANATPGLVVNDLSTHADKITAAREGSSPG